MAWRGVKEGEGGIARHRSGKRTNSGMPSPRSSEAERKKILMDALRFWWRWPGRAGRLRFVRHHYSSGWQSDAPPTPGCLSRCFCCFFPCLLQRPRLGWTPVYVPTGFFLMVLFIYSTAGGTCGGVAASFFPFLWNRCTIRWLDCGGRAGECQCHQGTSSRQRRGKKND